MPEADTFDAPQGGTFHGELLEPITEAFTGNGVLANGDGEVTADSNTAMGIQVAAAGAGIAYDATIYTPTSASFTLSDGPTSTTTVDGTDVDDRRVDIVVFNADSGAYETVEGTADPNPVPPATPANALLLAVVLVAHEAIDIGDSEILNWRARPSGAVKTGGGEAEFGGGLHVGADETDPVTETSSPTSFTYTAGSTRDIHESTDVALSNNSGASATEDVTVELYDGTGTGGTLLLSETQSISLNDGGSTTNTFIATDEQLDGGDYHINITTSGSDFVVDQVDEHTQGLEWSFTETPSGTIELTNRYTGTAVLSFDPLTDELGLLSGAIDTSELANDAVTQAKIASGAVGSSQIIDGTIVDTDVSSSTSIDRGKISDERVLSAAKTSAYTTSGEEVIPVDTSGGAVTITLATADLGSTSRANFVTIVDVGGSASVDNITVDTEGGEGIDDGTTVTVSTDYGATVVYADDTQWYTAGGGGGGGGGTDVVLEDDGTAVVDPTSGINAGAGLSATADGDGTGTVDVEHADVFEGRESGSVSNGNQGILVIDSLPDGATVEVYKAALTNADGSAVASSVTLELVTFDNAGGFTSQSTLISGDGSTVYDDETGSPLGSYTNTTGSAQSIGVLVDNGSGSSVTIIAVTEGETNA